MDMDYYACESCGIPGHKRDNCHEYLQKCEDARRKLHMLDVYYGDTPSFYPYYKRDNLEEILRKVKLTKINRALAEPHLSRKKQLFWLSWKYNLLQDGMQNRNSNLSVMEEYYAKERWISSQIQDDVVETNTTPLISVIETPETKSAMAEETVDEEVRDLLGQENESINSIEDKPLESLVIGEVQVHPNLPLASITQTTKVGEEGLRTKKKVTLQDLGQIIMKWLRNSVSIYMTISAKQFWNGQVNYRAFVGNVAGKCSLRPP
ncbi:hypothetical protein QVD17_38158 [Tagetes erecta]|uniref:CCHC-type domain-containing protein n=1 Tax=Tagetes erecta TaxID=13708 RepID=A0AAD8NKN5_TARER|nr:hypothetical protein QVD17_38158 [Tagetes erecta]